MWVGQNYVELDTLERTIYNHAKRAVDGERVPDLTDVPPAVFLGIVPPDEPGRTPADTTATPLNPDHTVWTRPDKDDSWVTTEKQARREIKAAIKSLIGSGVIDFDAVHERDDSGNPVDVTISVNEDMID